jgi:Ca2+-binding RTX toxin-like protein
VGGAYADTLIGNDADNTLGYAGGLDTMDGLAGIDTADFSRFGSAVWVKLDHSGVEAWTTDQANVSNGTWRAIADVAGIENLKGTVAADVFGGNAAANRIDGGAGADILTGGGGADRFDYDAIAEGLDTITDFTRGAGGDTVDIRDVLVGYAPGTSSPGAFVQLAQSSGNTTVSVNADGSGSDFVALCVLQGVTGLVLNDMISAGNLLLA